VQDEAIVQLLGPFFLAQHNPSLKAVLASYSTMESTGIGLFSIHLS